MTRCALLSWLGRRPVEATCHTGEAVLGAPRVASLQLCDSKYPHRKSKAQGSSLRAPMAPHTSMSGIERSRPRRKPTAACAQSQRLRSLGKTRCVATYHRKRQPPQAPRGPQRLAERVAPQEDKARTHAGSPKAEAASQAPHGRARTHAGSPKTERYLAHSTARDTPSTTPVLSVRGASTTGHAR